MDLQEVDSRTLQKLQVARTVEDFRKPVNALCFSEDCQLLLASSDDSRLCVYSVLDEPRLIAHIERSEGVTHITATHYNPAVLYASSPASPPLVQYFDYHREHEIWTCREHTQRLVDLAQSPTNDCFLSISAEGRLLYSDLRQRRSIFHCDLSTAEGTAACAFDPAGLVFGLSFSEEGKTGVRLFDVRNLREGPFRTAEFEGNGAVTSVEFSEDGDYVLVATDRNRLLSADALFLRKNVWIDLDLPPEAKSVAVFSACSKYILSGSTESGNVDIYDVGSGNRVWRLERQGWVGALAWNKKYILIVAAALAVDFWVPNLENSGLTQ